MNRYNEVESKINGVLPTRENPSVDPNLDRLTDELIEAGKATWETQGFTHSVCHLFEQYAGEGKSYLNATGLLPMADRLVNFTLRKANEDGTFGCVSRIVQPIADFNLERLEENPAVIAFRPEILADPEFIEAYACSRDVRYCPQLIDFCRARNIGEYFVKFADALRAKRGREALQDREQVVPGVFIDVDGTLIDYEYTDGKQIFHLMAGTQEYALRKLEKGVPVTIFTGAMKETGSEYEKTKEEIDARLREAGVDPRLCDAQSKSGFLGRILEICVDDSIPILQGFRARTYYRTGQEALDSEDSKA